MKSKSLFMIVSVFILVVLFQNCGQDAFQIASQSDNSLLDFPSDEDMPFDEPNEPPIDTSSDVSIDRSNTVSTPSTTGKVYYVSTAGSNSNAGTTTAKPFRTIAFAVGKMVAGDTTYVRGGVYNEGLIRFKISGTQDKPIKLLNYPKESPIIDFGVKSFKDPGNRIILHHSKGENVVMGWITIEGLKLRNAWDGIKFHSGLNLTFRRNWVDRAINQGIGGAGKNILIDRNIISSNGLTKLTHGIYGSGPNYTITNNLLYNSYGYGIQQAGTGSFDPELAPDRSFTGATNWIIANNTFAYNGFAAIIIWGSMSHNAQIINNIFYENARLTPVGTVQGILLYASSAPKGVIIKNNLSFASGSGGTTFFLDSFGKAVSGVNYTLLSNRFGNPLFVNAPANLPASPNFALTSKSPAIDKGLNLTSIFSTRTSLNGLSRPRGTYYDIGAYEY